MSMYSDFDIGAITEVEFMNLRVEEDLRDRYEREHECDDNEDQDDE